MLVDRVQWQPEFATALLDEATSVFLNGEADVVRVNHDRTVGELFLMDGRAVNVEMVRAGMAYHYSKYSGNCAVKGAIGQAEEAAQSNWLGVWIGEYQKPWDYRRMSH